MTILSLEDKVRNSTLIFYLVGKYPAKEEAA